MDVKSKLVCAQLIERKLVLTFEKEYQGVVVKTEAILPFTKLPNNMVAFNMTEEALEDLVALLDSNK